MAKTARRSRNIARKPKSRPNGFVPQNANILSPASEQRSGLAANQSPEAGIREPEAASGFVPQNATADASATQRAATNRANAQHSTGPRTAEGKARSAQNAFKHGLSLQRHTVLQHEDPAAYDLLREELAAIFAPASPREHLALEEIAHCRWALNRFDEAEATLLEYHFAHDAAPTNDEDDYVSYAEALGFNCLREPGERPRPECASFLILHRYRTHWDRRHHRAIAEFDRARKDHRHQLRDAERHEESARKAEREAAAERRREELHQLRLTQAQFKLQHEQAQLAREEDRKAREDAKSAAQQSKAEQNILFEALESYLNSTPHNPNNTNPYATQKTATAKPASANGFVPQCA